MCVVECVAVFVQVLEVTVVRDRHSGESKGFGFVRMATEQGAAAALQALDNYLIGETWLHPAGCSQLQMPTQCRSIGERVATSGCRSHLVWLPAASQARAHAGAYLLHVATRCAGNKRLAVRIKGRHGPAGRSGGLVGAPSGAVPAGPSLPPGQGPAFPPPPPGEGQGDAAGGAAGAGMKQGIAGACDPKQSSTMARNWVKR